MAIVKDLIVQGSSRFIGDAYTGNIYGYMYGDISGNAQTSNEWKTSRNFTIGNTTKPVDGSSDMQWSLDDIGFQSVQSDWAENDSSSAAYICNKPKTSKVFYGTCSTPAATVAKDVDCVGFTASDLVEGVMVIVKFDQTNSGNVDRLTLAVNSTGAKQIKKIYGDAGVTALTNAAELAAYATIPFIYKI